MIERPPRRRRRAARWSCPGSAQVSAQAEAEGLDEVFRAAGFDWRSAGCSMCLGMNPDILAPGERCASTSNRNFEGRQGARRAHAPGLARRWPPRRRSRATSSTSATGAEAMEPVAIDRRRRQRPRPRRRRHRPDHPQAVPQADRAHRLRRVPLLRLGQGARLGAARATRSSPRGRNFGCGSSREHAAVGARGLRLPRHRRAELRRHLLQQLRARSACSPVALDEADVRALAAAGEGEIDLEAQEVRFAGRSVAVRDRRGDPPAPARRPRRHRADAAAGRGDRRLRGARASAGPGHDGSLEELVQVVDDAVGQPHGHGDEEPAS